MARTLDDLACGLRWFEKDLTDWTPLRCLLNLRLLWIEPERGFLISRFAIAFEQRWVAQIDIDYTEDSRWGWIPSGWRVTELLADGSRRTVTVAKVSSYSINTPVAIEERR